MTTTYTWTFRALRVHPSPPVDLDDVVCAFEVRVRADDGETEGHGDWYAGVQFSDAFLAEHLDPDTFVAFPTAPAERPAFEAQLKAWVLDHLGMAEAEIEALALAQLVAHKARPIPKTLP